jgi:hypothetical protein
MKIRSDQWEEQPDLGEHTRRWDHLPPVPRHDLGANVQSLPSSQGAYPALRISI